MRNAESNAEVRMLNTDALVVDHIQVNKAPKIRRRTYRAHGRINRKSFRSISFSFEALTILVTWECLSLISGSTKFNKVLHIPVYVGTYIHTF